MKDREYTDIICRHFCRFYKEGKEDLHCMTYTFIREKLSHLELSQVIEGSRKTPDYSLDEEIKKEICSKCEFIEDGCDFREGLPSPPCGGYTVVEFLKKSGKL